MHVKVTKIAGAWADALWLSNTFPILPLLRWCISRVLFVIVPAEKTAWQFAQSSGLHADLSMHCNMNWGPSIGHTLAAQSFPISTMHRKELPKGKLKITWKNKRSKKKKCSRGKRLIFKKTPISILLVNLAIYLVRLLLSQGAEFRKRPPKHFFDAKFPCS